MDFNYAIMKKPIPTITLRTETVGGHLAPH